MSGGSAPGATGRPPISAYELRYRVWRSARGSSWNHAGTRALSPPIDRTHRPAPATRSRCALRNDEGWSGWSAVGYCVRPARERRPLCMARDPTPTERHRSPPCRSWSPRRSTSTSSSMSRTSWTAAEIWTPVSVTRGQAGSTTLAENVAALPASRYRVERYYVVRPGRHRQRLSWTISPSSTPCGRMNPLNPAPEITITDGAAAVPDRSTYETLCVLRAATLSTRSTSSSRCSAWTPRSRLLFFINSKTHRRHPIAFFLDSDRSQGAGAALVDPRRDRLRPQPHGRLRRHARRLLLLAGALRRPPSPPRSWSASTPCSASAMPLPGRRPAHVHPQPPAGQLPGRPGHAAGPRAHTAAVQRGHLRRRRLPRPQPRRRLRAAAGHGPGRAAQPAQRRRSTSRCPTSCRASPASSRACRRRRSPTSTCAPCRTAHPTRSSRTPLTRTRSTI